MFEIGHSLRNRFGNEDWCMYKGLKLINFVDNHDVSRIASILNNKEHLKAAYGILFSMPGIPCIYYGSEWGIEGEKQQGDDASLRPCISEPIENELTEIVSKLAEIHKESKAIQKTAFAHFLNDGDRQGDNLVIPVIGDDADDLYDKYISRLEDAGYDVEIKYQDADPVASLNRSISRAIETGRIIPSTVSFGYGDRPRVVFKHYKTKTNSKGEPYVRT